MISTKIFIPNKRGQKLAAVIDEPSGAAQPAAYAVFAHCFTCSKDLKAMPNINSSLAASEIATVRFDMTGIGESEGDFTETNFTTQIEDFLSVAEFLKQNYEAPKFAIGHSLGGSVAIKCAMKLSSIHAAAVIAAPSEPYLLSLKLKKTRAEAIKSGTAQREIGGVKYKFRPEFFTDLEKYDMERDLRNFKKPLLIIHSYADTYSDYTNAEVLYSHANEPKKLILLDDIDHLMLRKSDAVKIGSYIAEWFKKYMKF